MIAMALLLEPSLIIADEATSALDVTLQAQILELFAQVRDTHGTSILLVSHDLGVVAKTCDRVAVMYAGQVVESALGRVAVHRSWPPVHAGARGHRAVVRGPSTRVAWIPGRVPSLHEIPVGCSFAERCAHRHGDCVRMPQLIQVSPHHNVRCVLYESDLAAAVIHDAVASDGRSAANGEPASTPFESVAARPLLTARAVTKHFEARRSILERIRRVSPQPIRAVDRVDLDLQRGEILGLVGESGSGKTTLAMTLMRLTEANSGWIEVDGIDLRSLDRSGLRRLRSRMQMILQDPIGSLSPRMRVRDLLREPYVVNGKPVPDGRVNELLELVGLSSELAEKVPYQLSGGQARRVSIARALALEPALIVADEPTSGLDVSAAAGVLSLMKDLRDRLGVSYLIITHDLNVVGQIADRIAVMYLGQVVESGTTAQIFEDPVHPYTQGLLAAVPTIHDAAGTPAKGVPRGEMPSPQRPPSGCRFHTRCPIAVPSCSTVGQMLEAVDEHHVVACQLWPQARRSHPPFETRPTASSQSGPVTTTSKEIG